MSGESEQPVILIRLQRQPEMNADTAGPGGCQRVPSCRPSSEAQTDPAARLVRAGTPGGGRMHALQQTVPFGLIYFSVVTLWYGLPVQGVPH
jgi:hypothetical protein